MAMLTFLLVKSTCNLVAIGFALADLQYFDRNSPRYRSHGAGYLPQTSTSVMSSIVQGDFFNWASPENVPRLAPLKNASTGPPYFEKVLSMAAGRGEIPNTLTFSIPRGASLGL